jgi:hypothetical protein
VQQKVFGVATLLVVLPIIGRLTLRSLPGGLPTHFEVCVPCGNEGTADFILNVIMFMPVGFGFRLAGLRRLPALLIPFALSAGIEALQFFVITGRESDISDIIANSFGGALGVLIAEARGTILAPGRRAAGRLATAAALVCCVLAAAIHWALMPAMPATIYYEQVQPDLPGYDVLDGSVIDAYFDRQPFVIGPLTRTESSTLRDSLLSDHSIVTATLRPGGIEAEVAPIVAIHDQQRREILLLARHYNDLMFHLRRRSDRLGFHTPSLVLRSAFETTRAGTPPASASAPTDTAVDSLPGDLGGRTSNESKPDTVVARVDIAPQWSTLALAGGGIHVSERIGLGIWDAWRLLIPDNGRWAVHARRITVLWLVLLVLPLGYWAGCASSYEGVRSSLTGVAIAVLALFAIIPWAAGAPPAPMLAWVAGCAGVTFSWLFARWVQS